MKVFVVKKTQLSLKKQTLTSRYLQGFINLKLHSIICA